MTDIQYEATMKTIYEGKPITKTVFEQLSKIAKDCKTRERELQKQGRKAEAWWFKEKYLSLQAKE